MKNYLVKGHFSIMKETALQDYNTVKRFCESNNFTVVEPKGRSWKKIEDATAEMLHPISSPPPHPMFYLNRGLPYYKYILKEIK